jgi:hypothetical protein
VLRKARRSQKEKKDGTFFFKNPLDGAQIGSQPKLGFFGSILASLGTKRGLYGAKKRRTLAQL